MEERIKDLENLFTETAKLKVPSYQRAYAWEEEQLNQFVSDLLEMKDKGDYYYGHFILEKTNDGFEVIDGQQRLTTFILFLMVCRLFKEEGTSDYIKKFETVDYDREAFETIQSKLSYTNSEWEIEEFKLTSEPTLSIQRIVFALNFFKKLFKDGKSNLKLDSAEIDKYVRVLTEAHISTHLAYSKAVAVQIFELQNTRGIKLNLIEKIKSKLMKAVYLNAELEKKEGIINSIQKDFAEIYRLEETVSSNAFRGDLSLEEILLHHLRIIDNGSKLTTTDASFFNSPSKSGNREEAILNYIDKKITDKQNVVDYITNLVIKFKITVELVSKYLPEKDKINRLIGDVLILDKNLSLEFFILLYHKGLQETIENEKIIRIWEKLLFIRDFHEKYYNLRYRDNFEKLFYEIIISEKLESTLKNYVNYGFRPDSMDEGKLSVTVSNYIKNQESSILNNAFHWWNEKMVYALYKYEIGLNADLNELRKIMKEGRSVEHILPREWKWEWVGEKHSNNISENGNEMRKKVDKIINGIGNLMLITGSENSSQSNNHPKNKYYESCSGGSYIIHNENRDQWNDPSNWEGLINERGMKVYEFLKDYFIV